MAILSWYSSNNTVFSSIFLFFFGVFTGSFSVSPWLLAAQTVKNGHWLHKGAPPGIQIMAPVSMSAWLKSPALPGCMTSDTRASIFFFVDCFKISSKLPVTRDSTLSTLPSTAGTGSSKAMEAMAPAV